MKSSYIKNIVTIYDLLKRVLRIIYKISIKLRIYLLSKY